MNKMAVNSDFRLCAGPEGRKESREREQMIPENFSHQIFSTLLTSPGMRRTCFVCEKGQSHSPCSLSTQIYWKISSRGHKPLLSKP